MPEHDIHASVAHSACFVPMTTLSFGTPTDALRKIMLRLILPDADPTVR
jgi:hypothetical protein